MTTDGIRVCRSYLRAQHAPPHAIPAPAKEAGTVFVTISREAGARGNSVAAALAQRLNGLRASRLHPWTVLNQDLMERVLDERQLPPGLARFFPEARWKEIDATINTLLHRHPDPWEVWEEARLSICQLAARGHVIFVGRGTNFAVEGTSGGLHVRLVGTRARREAYLREHRGFSADEARHYVERTDRDRRFFVRQRFGRDVADPLAYTLVLNTDELSNTQIVDLLVRLIADIESAVQGEE
ncbi:MAG: AAA family ATPase [Verrucomicrobiota bacterium]